MGTNQNNPYSPWSHGVNPHYLLWEIFREPVTHIRDERPYSSLVINFLTKNAQLLESYSRVEDETSRDKDDFGAMLDSDGNSAKMFLYKNNLVRVGTSDDGLWRLEFYRPASKKCIANTFSKWLIERKSDSKVGILVMQSGELVVSKVSFPPPVIEDLELNYGTGFKQKYDLLVEKLNMRKSGIILMHGSPGSGKSTMLKHLSSFIDRTFIFIPPNLSDQLSSPNFISLLMSNKEAVLILEDAEQAVQSRENGQDTGSISTLLNLSDGILGNLLQLTIIISFNFNRDGIDPALLRPGRLLMDIDFPALSVEDAQKLSDKLGFKTKVEKPMTLAEVYNQNVQNNYSPVTSAPNKQMGFHTLIPDIATPKQNSSERKE